MREPFDAVRDHDRRRLRRVVPHRVRDHLRGWGRKHKRTDRRVGTDRRAADLDQVQRLRRRDRSLALQPQHLAVRRDAHRRQPSGDEVHPAAEVVRGADVDEPPLDRRLSEEHRGCGRLAGERADLRRDERVQARELVGRAAPGHSHLAVARRDLLRRDRERAVLHHEPPAEHGREDGGAGHDSDPDEQQAPAPAAKAGGHQAQRVGEPAKHQYSETTGV